MVPTLDQIRSSALKKIYCKCGRIVGLDKSQMAVKLKLKKELECPICRNLRISKDIDELNGVCEEIGEECW